MAYLFDSHPEHTWLAGEGKQKRVLVFDPAEGWSLFVHIETDEENVWTGNTATLEDIKQQTGIDRVFHLKELGAWLARRKDKKAALLGNKDLMTSAKEYDCSEESFGLSIDVELQKRLRDSMNVARSTKDLVELAQMMQAVRRTVIAFRQWMKMSMVGKTERQIRSEIEAVLALQGFRTAYHTIALVGPNAAILHGFEPTERKAQEGDTLLVDAASGYGGRGGYQSDVTRVTPIGKQFTSEQQALYEVVLRAQMEAIQNVKSGVEFRDIHARAVHTIAEGLVEMGILKAPADARVEDGSCELLFPHGLGHLLGLHTHDMERYVEPGRTLDLTVPGKRKCRMDFKVQPGQVFTIEPGVYLALWTLRKQTIREQYKDAFNWEVVDRLLETGAAGYGVRIEDDVLVTEEGPVVLTENIPKTVGEVHAIRDMAA